MWTSELVHKVWKSVWFDYFLEELYYLNASDTYLDERNVFMITFPNTAWKVIIVLDAVGPSPRSWLPGPLYQVPTTATFGCYGSELPPSLGNSLHPEGATSLGPIWVAVLAPWGQTSAMTYWYRKAWLRCLSGAANKRSSLWDEAEARFWLNPSLRLALPLALACVPHSLVGFKREHYFTVSAERESLSQVWHQQKQPKTIRTPYTKSSLNSKAICNWASLVAQTVKNLPVMQETGVRSLGWEDPLEKEMATHSSIPA